MNKYSENKALKKEQLNVPIWEKLLITVDEAAEYSHIGVHKIREMLEDPQCDFVLKKGAYSLIKRKKFEKYILDKEAI